MKKAVTFFLTSVMAVAFSVPAFGAVATPTPARVLVNEEEVEFQAYEINGYNYFKLREIDWALEDTAAGFEILYRSADRSIRLYKGPFFYGEKPEEPKLDQEVKNAVYSIQKVYLEDEPVSVHAYNIDGYNYFKLRDLAEVLGFDVEWDQKEKIISIYSENLYEEDTRDYADRKKAAEEARRKWERETENLDEEEAYLYLLINNERQLRGLRKLKLNEELSAAAEIRAKELEDYFHHIRPDGRNWSTVLKENDIAYKDAGEIIAYGSDHAPSIVSAWMAHEPHREKILNQDFEAFGIGYDSGRDSWSVLFIEN